MPDVEPENRIYLTYKARIVAEAKLRLYSKIANFLIIWYSFLLIVASVIELSGKFTISNFGIISASLSIFTFASSIYLATGTLESRANEFRACYLELQGIYNSAVPSEQKLRSYQEALLRYPNHRTRDSNDVIFDTWLRGGKLYDTKSEIKFGFWILSLSVLRRATLWAMVALFFLAPLWLAANLIMPATLG